jgi:holo-[acyl-carrier protein] synthase
MIVGVGVDLVEVQRIQSILDRHGEAFLLRILRPGEIEYCRTYNRPAAHVAARFAAKEAISKAFGTGIGAQLGWHDVEILRNENGCPTVLLHGQALGLLAQKGAARVLITLTHTAQHAMAVAILDSEAPRSHPA